MADDERVETLLDVLRPAHRRRILQVVVERGSASLDELTAAVRGSQTEPRGEEGLPLFSEIEFVHLPALIDANLVYYAEDSDAIVPTVTAEMLFECLGQICERRSR